MDEYIEDGPYEEDDDQQPPPGPSIPVMQCVYCGLTMPYEMGVMHMAHGCPRCGITSADEIPGKIFEDSIDECQLPIPEQGDGEENQLPPKPTWTWRWQKCMKRLEGLGTTVQRITRGL